MGAKLAVFDIDGTIATHGVLDRSALEGIRHLQSIGYITTLCTGRGYLMLKKALGEHFDEVVSDTALLVLEHGTKITDKNGNVQFAEVLGSEEINHIVDFIRANIGIIRLIWLNPEDVTRKQLIWCSDTSVVAEETDRRGVHGDLFTGSIEELRSRMLAEKLCTVGAKMNSFVQVHNLKLAFTRTPISVIFQDGNIDFIRSNTNKGLGILFLMKHLGVAYKDVLVAGNAINDVEMLDLSVGTRILVGPKAERDVILGFMSAKEDVLDIATPHALGEYLQNI